MDAVAVREKLRAFVTEQAAGEWDDKTISEDTTKLQAIVEEIVADAVSFASLSRPLLLVPKDGVEKEKGLDFSEALVALKEGKALARAGWDGKGMFIYMVPAAEYRAQTLVAKALFGEMVPYGAYTAMKTADGNVVPWLCSQSAQYATDWEIVAV